MNKDLTAIFEYLEREKGIKREIITSAIEEALLSAARKSVEGLINISVRVDPQTGEIEVFAQKEVVEEVTLPQEEISLETAQELSPDCEIGDWIDIETTPENFGRIAAQTARQVIAQKLRGAERDVIHEEYRHRINEIISGSVKRVVRGALIVDLGKVEAIMPDRFYPKIEHYNVGDRVQALLFEVRDTDSGGAEVVLSRSHPEFARQIFIQEVPELEDGTVTIERIVRDAGYRTKLAVASHDPRVDPVGACVGVRGTRVKNVIRELNNEKVDIMPFSEDKVQLLENALSPIEIKKISLSEDEQTISIVVDDEAYPTVLGKRGMNARLCGRLLEIEELDIRRMSEYQAAAQFERSQLALMDDPELDKELALENISSFVIDSLREAGYNTARDVLRDADKLTEVPGISEEMAEKVLEQVRLKR